MSLHELISPEMVFIDTCIESKIALFHQISQAFSDRQDDLSKQTLFDAFIAREQLGSTAIGHGVALPHIRLSELSTSIGCFIKLSNPIDLGADDKQPTDLIVALMVPDNQINQHLYTLSDLVKLFDNGDFRRQCRKADCTDLLYKMITLQPLPELTSD